MCIYIYLNIYIYTYLNTYIHKHKKTEYYVSNYKKEGIRYLYKCICFEAQVSLGPLISSHGPERIGGNRCGNVLTKTVLWISSAGNCTKSS